MATEKNKQTCCKKKESVLEKTAQLKAFLFVFAGTKIQKPQNRAAYFLIPCLKMYVYLFILNTSKTPIA